MNGLGMIAAFLVSASMAMTYWPVTWRTVVVHQSTARVEALKPRHHFIVLRNGADLPTDLWRSQTPARSTGNKKMDASAVSVVFVGNGLSKAQAVKYQLLLAMAKRDGRRVVRHCGRW